MAEQKAIAFFPDQNPHMLLSFIPALSHSYIQKKINPLSPWCHCLFLLKTHWQNLNTKIPAKMEKMKHKAVIWQLHSAFMTQWMPHLLWSRRPPMCLHTPRCILWGLVLSRAHKYLRAARRVSCCAVQWGRCWCGSECLPVHYLQKGWGQDLNIVAH